jgi:hypothetical protein
VDAANWAGRGRDASSEPAGSGQGNPISGQGNPLNTGKMPEQRTAGSAPQIPGQIPGQRTEPAGQPAGKKRRRWRGLLTWLLVGATVAAAAIMTFTFFAYRTFTEPNRSTPVVVVEQYVNATFTGDQVRARRFECSQPDLAELQTLVRDVESREAEFNVDITVTPASYQERITGDRAIVTARLQVVASGYSAFPEWEFSLRDQSGWRVCGAKQVT